MDSGWIKLHRSLLKWEWHDDPNTFCLWVHLLLMANHDEQKWHGMVIPRGSLLTGRKKLAEETGLTEQSVRTSLIKLEKSQNLTNKSTNKFTLITICNYDSYQGKNAPRCADECADDAPIARRSVSEKKNEKECKEIYNNNSNAHTHTREEEFILQYRTEARWPDACVILHIRSVDECKRLFDRWILEYQHKGQTHDSYTDFKGHFIQWARITIQKEQSNGNTDRSSQRRGIQVVANSVDDYEGPF